MYAFFVVGYTTIYLYDQNYVQEEEEAISVDWWGGWMMSGIKQDLHDVSIVLYRMYPMAYDDISITLGTICCSSVSLHAILQLI